jgi:hypothetical protein
MRLLYKGWTQKSTRCGAGAEDVNDGFRIKSRLGKKVQFEEVVAEIYHPYRISKAVAL